MAILTEKNVVELPRTEMRKSESITAWAKSVSLDRTHVSSVVHRRRRITKSVVRALGLRTAVVDNAGHILTESGILKLLGGEVAAVGGQTAWARKNRMNRAVLNKVLRKRLPPTAKMIRALGLRLAAISD